MIKILAYRQDSKGAREGFADVMIDKWADFFITDIAVFRKDDKRWISFYSKKTDETNEKGYAVFKPILGFKDYKANQSFQKHFFENLDRFLLENPPIQNKDSVYNPPKQQEFEEGVPF